MFIRELTPEDAAGFAEVMKKVESTSDFMMMEPGERTVTPEKQRALLEAMAIQHNSAIFGAENEDGEIIGYLIAKGGNVRKKKHEAYIIIGILEEYRGCGAGTKLFHHLEQWAMEHHISRLELTVVTENQAGVALYKKMGFELEGEKRHSLFSGGRFFNEYYYAKLLPLSDGLRVHK
ncbi:GNAT family N-acetyltransferase [Heyndrickxia acidicola]|uniref:GNAT family N-acetyltransferase n=1 Tax=Heyndrickxia acidicola TaxID=209389 RepID=A0ABU6MM06_9BACI|nr:GNAT family N-acetyltransferase [Heyndrickxia acidicola]MED1205718.1 GNAT family N-acetyltransferase [Heyndrickxia acidicola]